jgi:predicted Zn finger-like uncharacterized protein
VIITCPECDTKYRYDERRFDGQPSKRVKCTSCGLTFEAENPDSANRPLSPLEPSDPTNIELTGENEVSFELDLTGVEPPMDEESEPSPPAPEIDLEGSLPPLPRHLRYSLAVIAGDQAGSVYQIHKPRIFLGRGSAMDIQLRDSEVSRRHAVLEIRDPEVVLTDLGATNGTWVDGTRIQQSTLGHQDEFTLGSTTLMLIVTPVRDA